MRRRAKVLVAPVLGLALTGYFAYHLVEGDRGLRAWMRLTQGLRTTKMGLADVSTEPARLERPAGNMRSEHLDPDLLDSQVRRTLDFAAPDEIVIIQPDTPRSHHTEKTLQH